MSEPFIRLLRAMHSAPGGGVTDAELLGRVAAGTDPAAFELLLRRHADRVWTVCRRVARDHHAAEDAFQATFLALAIRGRSIRGGVGGWLYRVAYHAALKTRAAGRRAAPAGALDDRPAADTGGPPGAAEFAPIVHAELNALPDKYREPLVLCYLEGFTQAEAAERLGLALGTVATRVSRGGRQLRDRLVRRGVTLGAGGLAVALGPPARAAAELVAATAQLGGAPAGSWPGPIVHLMTGALSAMSSVKPKLVAGLIVCLAAAAGGLAVAGGQGPGGAPGGPGVGPPGTPLGAATRPPAGPPGVAPEKLSIRTGDRLATARQRARSADNLKQIMLAMHSYLDTYTRWPTGITDEQGQLLLSWRVQLLPYLEQQDLYKKFKLDEPWDSAHNKKLLAEMPEVFRVGFEPAGSTDTYYQMFTGVGTICDHTTKVTIANITDGTSNTLAVAEVGPPVPWTKPADVPYSARKPLPALELPFKNVWMVGVADGSALAIRTDVDPTSLRRFVERADGEVLDRDKLTAAPAPVTEEERKEAQALLKEVTALWAMKAELARERELLRAELEAMRPSTPVGRGGPDLLALERERAALRTETEALRKELAALKEAVRAAKAGKK